MKYSKRDFDVQFPSDDACLAYLLESRFGKKAACLKCKKTANYSRVSGRKTYACSWCGAQVSPTAGTIFHKSETPLKMWFHAIFLMSQSKNGVAAKEIERHVGVTYKTAFRMMHRIRTLMKEEAPVFDGTVEIDETYWGGRARGKRGRGADKKTPVFGIVKRGGGVYAQVVENCREKTVLPIILEHVKKGTNVMTDEFGSYRKSGSLGYNHQTVVHSVKEYVRGNVHTNTIEGFWGQLKRGLDGTHHSVSRKYLQNYVNEFSFRYNHRNASEPLFSLLLAKV